MFAEITEATLRVLPALLDPAQDGYDDTANITAAEAADVEDLFETPIIAKILHKSKILHDLGAKGAPGDAHVPQDPARAVLTAPSAIRAVP